MKVALGRILTLAFQDQLTGLANRSRFFTRLTAAIEAAGRRAETVAIIMMDLDRFKYVKDTLGHDVGDHVLRQVASRLRVSSGFLARLGALIRWAHPLKGSIPPVEFIPFAEHTGYIKVLTHWVLGEAIRQCGEWLDSGLKLQVSVNVSGRDLLGGHLPERIAALLAEHCVPAGLICLEITESGLMEEPHQVQKVLDRLSAMGLQLAIDDYGAGYSSLSDLLSLPVQELKIDRSLIQALVADADMPLIVRSTIELGHNLGMKVVAEGVEDGDGWHLLKLLGCDHAQGYFMSPPLEVPALVQWMHDHDGKGISGRAGEWSYAAESASRATYSR
jgi:predicted signal transduction protein with EAL and GGDEF domain